MSTKIYKHNPMIRGHFLIKDSEQNTLLSEFELDLLNVIYYLMQQNLWSISYDDITYDHMVFTSRYSDIKRLMNLRSKNHKEMIETAIENIWNTEVILKNFTTPDKIKHDLFRTRILLSTSKPDLNDTDIFSLSLNPIFALMTAQHKNNFTIIEYKSSASIKSKYAKRLYEFLKSKKQVTKRINMTLENLNELFGKSDENFNSHNKTLKSCKLKLFPFISFSHSYNRREKIVTITIDKAKITIE